jgi:molybdenum cofactor cytidylyltransferase
LVVGYKAELITPILDCLGVPWVLNKQYERGMLSSVLTGVRSVESKLDAFFLLPVDIPLVKPATIQALTAAYGKGHAWVIYPCFQGERGHPPLISTACLPKDLSYDYPGGLRAFLLQYGHIARDFEVVDQAILMDCDTPADYERMWAYAGREDIPTERECEALWVHLGVPEEVIAHSRVVAQLARRLVPCKWQALHRLIGSSFEQRGNPINSEVER